MLFVPIKVSDTNIRNDGGNGARDPGLHLQFSVWFRTFLMRLKLIHTGMVRKRVAQFTQGDDDLPQHVFLVLLCHSEDQREIHIIHLSEKQQKICYIMLYSDFQLFQMLKKYLFLYKLLNIHIN